MIEKGTDAAPLHPLVARSRSKPKRPIAVGIVYDKNGVPKISPDWVKNLPADHRKWVNKELHKKGFKINVNNTVEKLDGNA